VPRCSWQNKPLRVVLAVALAAALGTPPKTAAGDAKALVFGGSLGLSGGQKKLRAAALAFFADSLRPRAQCALYKLFTDYLKQRGKGTALQTIMRPVKRLTRCKLSKPVGL